jgi:hypothetical protein
MEQQTRQQEASRAAHAREINTRVMSTIDQFREAKSPAGALLHPHFADVEDDMTRLAQAAMVRGEEVPSLDELYDKAVWAYPSTRTRLIEERTAADMAQHAATEQKRAAEARAKAERARRAGSSVTGSPGHGQSAAMSGRKANGSIMDDLRSAYEEHSNA